MEPRGLGKILSMEKGTKQPEMNLRLILLSCFFLSHLFRYDSTRSERTQQKDVKRAFFFQLI